MGVSKKDSIFVFFAMSFADKGTLMQLIAENVCISAEIIRSYLFQILCTLVSANNQKKFLHRDVKPNNFVLESVTHFITRNSELKKNFNPKQKQHCWLYALKSDLGKYLWRIPIHNIVQMIDFGLSEFLSSKSRLDRGGTKIFMSPDSHVLDRPTHSKVGDLWGVGCILLQLTTCSLPLALRKKFIANEDEPQEFLEYLFDSVDESTEVQDFIAENGDGIKNDRNEIEKAAFCSILIHMFGNPLFLTTKTFKKFAYNKLGKLMLTQEWKQMIQMVYDHLGSTLKQVYQGIRKVLKEDGIHFLKNVFSWSIYESEDLTPFLFFDFFDPFKIESEIQVVTGKYIL